MPQSLPCGKIAPNGLHLSRACLAVPPNRLPHPPARANKKLTCLGGISRPCSCSDPAPYPDPVIRRPLRAQVRCSKSWARARPTLPTRPPATCPSRPLNPLPPSRRRARGARLAAWKPPATTAGPTIRNPPSPALRAGDGRGFADCPHQAVMRRATDRLPVVCDRNRERRMAAWLAPFLSPFT
jgi:hypothetical protein